MSNDQMLSWVIKDAKQNRYFNLRKGEMIECEVSATSFDTRRAAEIYAEEYGLLDDEKCMVIDNTF